MKKKIILIIIVVLIIFSNFVWAESLEELQEQKDELQNQINQSNEQIEQIEIKLTENLEKLNNLDEKIYEYESQIALLEKDLKDIKREIKKITEKLNLIEENYNLQKEALENRVVALYESGDIIYLDVLLSSNTFSEFISNYYLIGEIVKYDNELLDNIVRQKEKIESIKKSLEENEQSIKETQKNKEKVATSLQNSKVIRSTYVNKLTEEEKKIQSEIKEYETQLNTVESKITALTIGEVGGDYVGGEFAWPAPGYTTITSKFGMRIHPIFKTARLHTGVDIAMPTGSNIVAANDGIVIKSMYATGYGNMVMISHGGGVSTVYGHGSEILVQTGQAVMKNDPIMKAGSTGWSTGPHLHFEIRINGKTIDPLPFIINQSNNSETQENGGED